MFRNYILVAFRNLTKNKTFSFINIAGLAIGMAACLLILQYVSFELSFDNFHEKKDRIYRINQDRFNNGKLSTRWAGGAFAPGSAFKAALPEIEDFVKMVPAGQVLVNYKDQKMIVDKDYFVGPSFFKIFSYKLLSGDPKTALTEPNTVVISETVAQKLFHNQDAVGQTLVMNNDKPIKVTGVMKDMPVNSHMKLDFMQSYSTLIKNYAPQLDNQWENDGCTTYLLLRPGVDPKKLEAKFLPIVKKAYSPFKSSGDSAVYTLRSMQSIHMYSNLMFELQPNSNGDSVYLLLGIAIFVIIIAWINYINLATARSIGRAKEVGVRKTLGSDKRQLILQFMFEAALLNIIALFTAFILIALFLPVFSALSGVNISFALFGSLTFWLSVLGMIVMGSFFAGFYPALVLSSFRPVDVMKGKLSASPKGVILRKGMVVFQFTASIFLLIGSLTVFRQIQFMQKQSLGLNVDQTLVIKPPLAKVDSFMRTMISFKNECLKQPGVKSVTASTVVPGEPIPWNAGGIKLHGADQSTGKQYRIVGGDYDFLNNYDFKLLAGRKISKEFTHDTASVVLSKKAAEQMGFNKPGDAVNQKIDFWGKVYTVVGVVDNYHQQSLRDAYDAIIFRCIPDVRGDISVKINAADAQQTIEALHRTWKTYFPGDQYDYFFLDDHFNQQYHADKQFGQVFATFTLIAIIVACLGLFGLVSYTIVQRTKEIGIRKVLGATVNNIVQMLYKDFVWLILIAFCISIPLGLYAINKWLQGYAFRIDIGAFLFVIPFFIVMAIALVTVSLQSVKAALANPVKSLKTE